MYRGHASQPLTSLYEVDDVDVIGVEVVDHAAEHGTTLRCRDEVEDASTGSDALEAGSSSPRSDPRLLRQVVAVHTAHEEHARQPADVGLEVASPR